MIAAGYHYFSRNDFDSAVEIAMGFFIAIHLVLAFIAVIDTGKEEPGLLEKIARLEFCL